MGERGAAGVPPTADHSQTSATGCVDLGQLDHVKCLGTKVSSPWGAQGSGLWGLLTSGPHTCPKSACYVAVTRRGTLF